MSRSCSVLCYDSVLCYICKNLGYADDLCLISCNVNYLGHLLSLVEQFALDSGGRSQLCEQQCTVS